MTTMEAAAVSVTDLLTTSHRPLAVAPISVRSAACGCGQPLDLCHHAHCPRCGVLVA